MYNPIAGFELHLNLLMKMKGRHFSIRVGGGLKLNTTTFSRYFNYNTSGHDTEPFCRVERNFKPLCD
jgi:hypothetical protein